MFPLDDVIMDALLLISHSPVGKYKTHYKFPWPDSINKILGGQGPIILYMSVQGKAVGMNCFTHMKINPQISHFSHVEGIIYHLLLSKHTDKQETLHPEYCIICQCWYRYGIKSIYIMLYLFISYLA